ncbi:MAG: hypothetical protein PUJ59_05015 [Clostridiaceae bacterium]|nr:hypothetical protein [Clostridiaceae bacterium]MDY5888960.1 hypothetical protein [Oscillospiraceae bacterium]
METVKNAWDFFQNEILGMHWLNKIIENFLNICGLDTTVKPRLLVIFIAICTAGIIIVGYSFNLIQPFII